MHSPPVYVMSVIQLDDFEKIVNIIILIKYALSKALPNFLLLPCHAVTHIH